jgi:hypothetical protein
LLEGVWSGDDARDVPLAGFGHRPTSTDPTRSIQVAESIIRL